MRTHCTSAAKPCLRNWHEIPSDSGRRAVHAHNAARSALDGHLRNIIVQRFCELLARILGTVTVLSARRNRLLVGALLLLLHAKLYV